MLPGMLKETQTRTKFVYKLFSGPLLSLWSVSVPNPNLLTYQVFLISTFAFLAKLDALIIRTSVFGGKGQFEELHGSLQYTANPNKQQLVKKLGYLFLCDAGLELVFSSCSFSQVVLWREDTLLQGCNISRIARMVSLTLEPFEIASPPLSFVPALFQP